MSLNKAVPGEEQPDEGTSECVDRVSSVFEDQPRHPAAPRWRWWWCPVKESLGEKKEASEELTWTPKTISLKELKQASRKQKREEKMHKTAIKMTEITDKTNLKFVRKQVNLQKCKKENDKAPPNMNKARIESRNTKTGIEKVTANTKPAARIPVTNPAKRVDSAKRVRRLKKEMVSNTPQTQGSWRDSFLPPPSTRETGRTTTSRGVSPVRLAVAALLLLHMIVVEVFGYLLFYE